MSSVTEAEELNNVYHSWQSQFQSHKLKVHLLDYKRTNEIKDWYRFFFFFSICSAGVDLLLAFTAFYFVFCGLLLWAGDNNI